MWYARLLERLIVLYGTRFPLDRGKWRIAEWYMKALTRRHALDTETVRVRRQGFSFDLRLNDYVDQWIYLTGFYERDDYLLLVRSLDRPSVVFDVGAHLGFYTLGLARAVGNGGRVHAFEPNPASADRLRNHVLLNDVRNVILNRCALGEARERRALLVPRWSNTGGATLRATGFPETWEAERVIVDVAALDEYCEQSGVSRIDLVKIDCEGHEPFVVQGARESLRRFRPRLQVEFNQRFLEDVGWRPDDMLELLHSFDYDVYHLRAGCLSPVVRAGDHAHSINLHCLPRPHTLERT